MKRTLQLLEAAGEGAASSEAVFQAACRDVAEATGANRVSVWRLDRKRACLDCLCFYIAPEETFTRGQLLKAVDLPTYFKAILTENVINAPEARRHVWTRELVDPYFREHDIYSLLDFVIQEKFQPIGVICCENAGAVKRWRDEDVAYLRQMATLISFRLKPGSMATG